MMCEAEEEEEEQIPPQHRFATMTTSTAAANGNGTTTTTTTPAPTLSTPKLAAAVSDKLPSLPSLSIASAAAAPTSPTSTKTHSPPITTPTEIARSSTHYNTHKLGVRVGIDAVAAASAGVLVAPLITMIDKGIMENASGRCSLKESLRKSAWEFATRPVGFLTGRPFWLVMTLYFGTYFTANTTDTLHTTLSHDPTTPTPYTTTTSGTPKFVATSASNLALCLYKDSRFTQLFSASTTTTTTSPKRPVPLPTFALFTIRDCLTIFASFNLPPLLAPHIEHHLSDGIRRYASSASVAQFVTPAAVQVFSTPLHLLGLDLYNRPSGGGGSAGAGARRIPIWGRDGRAERVLRDWGMSAVARMGRIVPAFGVGGVVNAKVRRGLMGRVE